MSVVIIAKSEQVFFFYLDIFLYFSNKAKFCDRLVTFSLLYIMIVLAIIRFNHFPI